MDNLVIIENLITTIIITILAIIASIKGFKIWKETKLKDIELKEEIKNYYRRRKL